MPLLNNPSSPDIKKTPYLSVLNNHSVIQNNCTQSHTSIPSTPALIDVFQTPTQSANSLTKSSLDTQNDGNINENENITVGGIDTTNNKHFQLGPGFISSNNIIKTPNSVPISASFSTSSFHLTNYTPATNFNNFINKPILNNSNTANSVNNVNNVNSVNNNLIQNKTMNHQNFSQPNTFDSQSDSKFSNDMIGNHSVNEHFDQSPFLNTPTSMLSLQSQIQQQPPLQQQQQQPPPPHLRANQYLQFDPISSSVNPHQHTLSVDTLTSAPSTKSFGNDDWLNYNNHNTNFSNTAIYQQRQFKNSNNTDNKYSNSNNSNQLQNWNQDQNLNFRFNQNDSEIKLLNKAREYSKYSLDPLSDEIKDIDKTLSSYTITNHKELRSLSIKKKTLNQLFALALLIKNFRITEKAICPRNMVYLRYVEICKKSSITPICNAAFGKMVKIFNPKIKTRRLGVRGSSRYNYCGIELIENDNENSTNNDNEYQFDSDNKGIDSNSNSVSTTPMDNSLSISNSKSNLNINFTPLSNNDEDKFNKKNDILPSYDDYYRILVFPTNLFNNENIVSNTTSDLPYKLNLDLNSNSNTELDFSNVLINDKNIKESHMIIINKYSEFLNKLFIDWRYLRVETFFNDLDNFHFKDLLNDKLFEIYESEYLEILPLIAKYDIAAVKEHVKIIIKILFQKVPDDVQVGLLNFENYLITHIKNMDLKFEIINEKIKISKILINITKKIRKIIHLSSSFSKFLKNKNLKKTFLNEWLHLNIDDLINGSIIVPDFQKDKIIAFLKNNFTNVLTYLGVNDTLTWEESESLCQDLIINQIASFFTSIPNEFNTVDPKSLIIHIEHIGSMILRELTTDQNALSFSPWWSLVCWSNEYMLLMAEIGSLFNNL